MRTNPSVKSNTLARLRMLKLEQRMLFDGAAAVTAVEATDAPEVSNSPAGDDSSTNQHELAPVTTTESSNSEIPQDIAGLFSADNLETNPQLAPVLESAQQQIRDFLQANDAHSLFTYFNGGQTDPTAEWLANAEALRQAILSGNFHVNVVEMDAASQFTAVAAYTSQGPEGERTVFINRMWFDMFDAPDATRALVEEFGHAMDDALNVGADTAGDEGQVFATTVMGTNPSDGFTSGTEAGQVVVKGVSYEVEFASFNFTNAYRMVYDLDNDTATTALDGGTIDTSDIDTTERWADKEQNSHYFDAGTDATLGQGLGPVIIDDNNYDSRYFSGNDVSAIGINIGGTTYYGWVSRPIKAGGIVRGFYFWTDTGFTNLATAQADGNRDIDGSVLDNKGFLLVVDQTWFTQQIATKTQYTINNTKDGNLGTIWVSNVGSSSDRVDSALNSLISPTPNLNAVDDASDITLAAGVTGGPALELGSDGNDPTRSTYYPTLNTTVSTGVLTNTVNAIGNVITNDTSATSVTRIESNSTKSIAGVTSLSAGVIQGLYGTLTINANGSYSYAINNDNSAVNALLPSDTPLADVFTYTVTDGKSTTDTATLTVRIKGSNDAPIAYHDTNIAKEITSTANTGYSATGNVISNDTDVDANDHLAVDLGMADKTVTIDVATYKTSSVTPKTELIFVGNLGNNISNGKPVGIRIDNTNYILYTGLNNTVVTVSGSPVLVTDNTNNALDEYAVNLSSTTLYYDTDNNGIGDKPVPLSGGLTFVFASNTGNITGTQNDLLISKEAAVVGKEVINLSSYNILKNELAVGMELTGTGWPSGSYISALTDNGTYITSMTVTVSQNIDTTTYPTIQTTFSLNEKTLIGKYGTLLVDRNGSYTYTPYTDIAKYWVSGNTIGSPSTYTGATFAAGASDTDVFTYTVKDQLGAKSKADLTITVFGSGTSDPLTSAGTKSIDEAGFDAANATRGAPNPVTGNVTITGTYTALQLSSNTTFNGGSTGTTNSTNVSVTTSYGTLTLYGDRTYSYQLNNASTAVNALQLGQTLTDTFYYKAINSTLGASVNSITITINGSNDTPVAYSNTGSLTEDSGLTAQGNVIRDANASSQVDTDVDNGDSFTVTNIANTVASSNSSVTGATTIAGVWGYLTINTDGSYSYRHYVSTDTSPDHTAAAATIQNMTVGDSEIDTFTYTITDSKGRTSSADLEITLNGANETPVNTTPTSVSTTAGSYTFTTGLSVADPDNNVKTVVLHVDNGTLSIDTTTLTAILSYVTITPSDGGKTITLTLDDTTAADRNNTDGEDYINQLLAKLRYQVDTAADGQLIAGDYLTIFTTDTNGAYDSDGFAINIPVTATVNEAGLAQNGTDVPANGSNFNTNSETFTTQIELPLGRKVADVSPTNTTYGTYSITSGVLTYTLTKRVDHSGSALTDTFSYTITDLDGTSNAVVTPVTIKIVDDGPQAVADTNNAQDGGSAVTGNVLTDGNDDVFGADGAKTTTPTGGVVGVKAGNDTSAPVTTGADGTTTITGTYGTLTMASDGSYTYTPGSNLLTTAVTDVFVYTIKDADGSYATTTLTITLGTSSVADLNIAKTATVNAAGTEVTYTLVVTNQGGSNATGVTVTDTPPAGLTYTVASLNSDLSSPITDTAVFNPTTGVWEIGNLAVNGTATLYLKASITAGTASIANTATVDGDQYDNDTADNSSTVTPPVADLNIAKTATVNAAGTEVTYTLVVTNQGGSNATGVTVTDTPPAGLTYTVASLNSDLSSPITDTAVFNPTTGVWEIGNLAVNGTATLYLKASITAGTASIANTATVDGDQYDNDTADNSSTVTPPVADLNIAKTATVNAAGTEVTYTLVVTNQGGSNATGVTVTDTPPAGLTYTVASLNSDLSSPITDTAVFNPTTGVWEIGNLAVNGTATLYLKASITAGTASIANTATVDGDQYDNDTADNSSTVTPPVADLNIAKTATVNAAGTEVTYTLVVTNQGGSNATGVTVTDTPPAGLTYTVASLNSDLSSPITDTAVFNPTTGVWEIGNLAVNGTATLYLKASITAGTASIANTATVDGDQYDNDTADNSSTVTPPVADLNIAKTATVNAAGTEVTYTLVVTNQGGSNATGVTVTDTPPAGLTYTVASLNSDLSSPITDTAVFNPTTGVWEIGNLAVNGTATLYLKASITAGTASIANTATVDGDQYDNDTADNSSTVTPPVADLNIAKTATVNAAGTEVTYTLVVTNQGGSNATGVTVTDTPPAGLTYTVASLNSDLSSPITDTAVFNPTTGVWEIGNLAVNGTATLYLKASITAGTASIANTATVDGDQYDNDTADNSSTVTPPVADLNIAKTATVNAAGTEVTYTLVVTNQGGSNATGVTVTDTPPAGLTYTVASLNSDLSSPITDTAVFNPTTGVWEIGNLAVNGTATLYLKASITAGTASIANTATVDGDQYDNDTADNSSTVTPPVADLNIAKTATVNAAGTEVTYTLVVTNQGGSNATGVTVTDTPPAGLTYTVASLNSDLSSPITDTAVFNPTTGVWEIGNLAVNGTATLYLKASITAGTASIANTATVDGDQYDNDTADNSSTVTPPVADLNIAKTATVNAAGTEVTYTLVVTNQGGSNATGVTVTDTPPAGLTYTVASLNSDLSSPITDTAVFNPTTGVWEIGNLAVNGTATLYLKASITAGTASIANTATVDGDQYDNDTADNSSTVTPPVADLNIAKTATVNAAGTEVTYTLVVTNQGGSNATGVTVTDTPPAGLTYTVASLNSDLSSPITDTAVFNPTTGVWEIGNLAVNGTATLYLKASITAGTASIANTATVDGDQYDNDTADNSSTVTPPVADLNIAKSVNSSQLINDLSGYVVYTLVASNAGGDEATGVTVTDQLPSGLTFVEASTVADFASTVDSTVYDDSTGLWTIGNLAANGSSTLYIKASVNSYAPIINTASINGNEYDPDTNNNEDDGSDNNQTVNVAPPHMTIGNATVEEGSKAVFSVTVGEAKADYKITFATSFASQTADANDIGATLVVKIAGVPVTPNLDGSYTVPAGTTALTVEVTTTDDSVFEGSETFLLTGKTEFMTTDTSGTGTIKDDGTATDGDDSDSTADNDKPQMTIGNVNVEEGSKAVFSVTVGEAKADYKITFATSFASQTADANDIGATLVVKIAGVPVTPNLDGSYTVPAGTTALTVEVTTTDDSVFEGSETFLLTGKTEFMTTDTSGTGTIKDDGTATDGDDSDSTADNDKPQMTIGNVNVEEGSKAVFSVTVGEAKADYKITFATSFASQTADANDIGATLVVKIAGVPVTPNLDGSYTVPAGTTALTVEVTTTDDSVFEGSETFLLTGKTEFMTTDTSGTGTIKDDGTATDGDDSDSTADNDKPQMTIGNVNVEEGSKAVFSVTVGEAKADYKITFATSFASQTADANDIGATLVVKIAGVPVTPNLDGSYTVPAGTTALTVEVTTTDDSVFEGSETFLLTGKTEFMTTDTSGTGTIKDDGTATDGDDSDSTADNDKPQMTIGNVNVEEGSKAVFSVTVGEAKADYKITFATSFASQTADANDIGATLVVKIAGVPVTPNLDGSYTVPAGTTALTVEVTTTDDSVFEGSETFLLTGKTEFMTTDTSGTGTIKDDGTATDGDDSDSTADNDKPQMTIGNVNVEEGSKAVFSVTVGEAKADYKITFATSFASQTADANDIGATLVVKIAGVPVTPNLDGSYTVPAGTTALTVEVTTTDDSVFEGSETFLLTGKTEFMTTDTSGTGTIKDDGTATDGDDSDSTADNDKPQMTIGNVNVEEGSKAVFSVTVGEAKADYKITFATSFASQTADANDIGATLVVKIAGVPVTPNLDGSYTVPAGTTALTVEVTTTDDSVFEGSETFLLTGKTEFMTTDTSGTGTIKDDGTATDGDDSDSTADNDKPQMTIGNVNVEEGSKAVFSVTVGEAKADYKITFATSFASQTADANDIGATLVVKIAGVPVTPNLDGSYTVPAGTTALTVEVTTTDDSVFEGSETFLLTGKTEFMTTDTSGTGTIKDDGTATDGDDSDSTADNDKPQMTIGNVNVEEGSKAVFSVTVGEAKADYKITFATSFASQTADANDIGATLVVKIAGVPVTPNLDGSYTVPAGTTALTVEVTTTDDSVFEGSETFLLTGKTEFMTTDTSGTGTIKDDGTATDGDDSDSTADNDKPQMTIGNVNVEEGSKAVFSVTVGEAKADYKITFATSFASQTADANDIGATLVVKIAGVPVTPNLDGSYTVPAGTTALTVEVTTTDDSVFEGSETFLLTGKTEFMTTDTSGTGTIKDDGTATDGDDSDSTADNDKPQMTIGNVNVEEGSKAVFSVTVGEAKADYKITFATSFASQTADANDIGATLVVKIAGVPVTPNLDGSYTVPAGTTALTVEVTTTDDSVFEGETFLLTGKTEFMTTDTSGTGTIKDDGTATDGDDSDSTADNDKPQMTIGNVNVEEGSKAVFSVTVGEAKADYKITIKDDGTATDGDDSDSTADNDKPQMTIGNVNVEEGSKAVFSVTVGEAKADYKITFATSFASQTADANDIGATLVVKIAGVPVTPNLDGSYTVPAGTTALTVEVTTTDDSVFEGSETFLLTGKTEFMTTDTSGTGTIKDDGTATDGDDSDSTADNDKPQMTIGNVNVEEGSKAVFSVTVGEAKADYKITFATSFASQTADANDIGATLVVKIAGVPVTPNLDGSYTVPAGTTALTVEVTTTDDSVFEGSETFLLTGKTEFMTTDTSGTGTIQDNDRPQETFITPPPPPPTPSLPPPTIEVTPLNLDPVQPVSSSFNSQIGSFDPSAHVLAAVNEAQAQVSGNGGAEGNFSSASSIGAGLGMDTALHVLPAVGNVGADVRSVANAIRNIVANSLSPDAGNSLLGIGPIGGGDTPGTGTEVAALPIPEANRPANRPAADSEGSEEEEEIRTRGEQAAPTATQEDGSQPIARKNFSDQLRLAAQNRSLTQAAQRLAQAPTTVRSDTAAGASAKAPAASDRVAA
jgi:large repetitive protein